MKNIYMLLFVFLLLIMGCSSTYTVQNFHSKEKFYEDFNNSVKTKEVKVYLNNENSFTVYNGAYFFQDTLFTSILIIPINKVNKVSYINRWKGLPYGVIFGLLTGLATLSTIVGTSGSGIFSTILGAIIGTITAWLIGWENIYQFNP
jgi:hypothetical protein